MMVRIDIQSPSGPGHVEWHGDEQGLNGEVIVHAPPEIREAIEARLQPGSHAWYAPDLGGGFEGFDPTILRHVQEGVASLSFGRKPVLTGWATRDETTTNRLG